MRLATLVVSILLLTAVAGLLFWSCSRPVAAPTSIDPSATAASQPVALRIALVPERNIFELRHRYQVLADYLSAQLHQPVEIVTLNTYQAILDDFAQEQADAAFLGSLSAVLTMDRLGAQALAVPRAPDGGTTYRGVIFVREDSPVRSVADLAGRKIASVKTTTAGELFLYDQLKACNLLPDDEQPRVLWVGTHDDAILEVVEGRADAGAAKDLRVQDFMRQHPEPKLRWLAVGPAVPNNALVVRADMPRDLKQRLLAVLLAMKNDPAAQSALEQFGAVDFVPCDASQYAGVYAIVQRLGEDWQRLNLGSPPQPPTPMQTQPAAGGDDAAP